MLSVASLNTDKDKESRLGGSVLLRRSGRSQAALLHRVLQAILSALEKRNKIKSYLRTTWGRGLTVEFLDNMLEALIQPPALKQ